MFCKYNPLYKYRLILNNSYGQLIPKTFKVLSSKIETDIGAKPDSKIFIKYLVKYFENLGPSVDCRLLPLKQTEVTSIRYLHTCNKWNRSFNETPNVTNILIKQFSTESERLEQQKNNLKHTLAKVDSKILSTQNSKSTSEPISHNAPVPNLKSSAEQINYDELSYSEEIIKLFSHPKNKLHNAFNILAQEKKQNFLEGSPKYRIVTTGKKSKWLCTYILKWPKEMKFVATDTTKSQASHKAALAALVWLYKEKKISDAAMPLIYQNEELKKISKERLPSLYLDNDTVENMRKIVDIHQKLMLPHIIKSEYLLHENEEDYYEEGSIQEPSDIESLGILKQKFLGFDVYQSKEKIELPITKYKAQFIEILKSNQVVIVRGEPGCGKSTRIPQYVLESWAMDGDLGEPSRIVVTQPRRIAAISLAERVSKERNETLGNIVGYQVRLNSNFRPATGRILYCTTGILLRYLQSDPKLMNFTHIILDEAHERDVNTDLLMNILRSTIKENPKLKLIVMSATIDTSIFSKYFGDVPVMEIPGFTYPVKEYFLEECNIDIRKTLKMCEGEAPTVIHEDIVKVINYIHKTKPNGAILCFLPGWEDINKIWKLLPLSSDLKTYCLHSRLQDNEQWKIFSKPPQGVRKVILSTNIAETSVTIDDVVYVIDTGIHKDRRFDVQKGINCIDNHWISKASVMQRKGRAGRVQPGECYHLYPRWKYDSFIDYTLPEIMRTSLTKIVLDSKVYSQNMDALEFMGNLLSPPSDIATLKAVEELKDLELLDSNEKLTSLGKTVAEFQLEPKLSKAMVNAVIFKCVTPIVDIVTLFSAETEFFISGLIDKADVNKIKSSFCTNSDHLAMMRLFEKWLEIHEEYNENELSRFCDRASLVPHKMKMVQMLRSIHFGYLHNGLYKVLPITDDYSDNDEMVKAVLFSGVGNVLQHRNWDIVKNRFKNNVNVLLTRNNHKATITQESVNFKRHTYPTNFLMYINETRSNIRRTTVVRECTLIPSLSVMLFSNKNLEIKEVDAIVSNNHISDDQVRLALEDTNIKIICNRKQAEHIVECKNAIMSCYQYYIKQLTDTGERNPEVNTIWDEILSLLDKILNKNCIDT